MLGTQLVRTLTRGSIPASSLVVGDTLYGLQDDFTTQEVATVTDISSAPATFRTLKLDGQTLLLTDSAELLVQDGVGEESSVTPANVVLNDFVVFTTATDILSEALDLTAYSSGYALTGDPTAYSYKSKCAYLAGMIDAFGSFYSDTMRVGVFFASTDSAAAALFSSLCVELAGDMCVTSTSTVGRSNYTSSTRTTAMAHAVFDAVSPYLVTWSEVSFSWPTLPFCSRVIRTDTTSTATNYVITTDKGGLILLGNGVAVQET